MRNLTPPSFNQQVRGRIVIIGLLLLILTVSFIALAKRSRELQQEAVYDYETCSVAQGSRILELYPSICISSDGRYFGQVIPEETH